VIDCRDGVLTRKLRGVPPDPPLCPTCEQPTTESLGGQESGWVCDNEACPEYGQLVQIDDERP
jgi:hypothetical protein